MQRTHTATKVYAGEYKYRGYSISNGELSSGGAAWFINKDCPQPDVPSTTPTLREAKFWIDIALDPQAIWLAG